MQSSCYRCGAEIEDRTTFCPSCGAPQIKVAAPEPALTNQPSTPPLPPGTPDSVQPPAVPVNLIIGRIRWKQYQRIAISMSVAAGAGIALFPPLGLLVFLGATVYGVVRYRREHPGPLSAFQGAKLGTLNGFISFVVAASLQVARYHGEYSEYRRQRIIEFQQRYAGNPDPQVQQFVHWAATNEGFLVLFLLSLVLALAIFLLASGLTGALTAALSGNRPRR